MTLLNIPTVISNAMSSLTSHHGHKKGVHDGGSSNPLNSSSSSSSSSSSAPASANGQPTGSTQSLFGTLLDSVEQVLGIQTATTAPSVANTPVTPASITAAQAALKKV